MLVLEDVLMQDEVLVSELLCKQGFLQDKLFVPLFVERCCNKLQVFNSELNWTTFCRYCQDLLALQILEAGVLTCSYVRPCLKSSAVHNRWTIGRQIPVICCAAVLPGREGLWMSRS